MIPSRFEYLIVLVVMFLFVVSLFGGVIRTLLHRSQAWLAFAGFLLVAMAVDIVAIHLQWWTFAPDKVCGIAMLTIPIEEYLLFVEMYLLTIASWESFRHEMA